MAKVRTVSATEFKAKCLGLLDEVAESGDQITVTKRGRPVAMLGPVETQAWKSPANSWADRGKIVGDIVNLDTSGLWNIVTGEGEN